MRSCRVWWRAVESRSYDRDSLKQHVAAPNASGYRLGATMHAELFEDGCQVKLDSASADAKTYTNGGIAQTLGQRLQHFTFAIGER